MWRWVDWIGRFVLKLADWVGGFVVGLLVGPFYVIWMHLREWDPCPVCDVRVTRGSPYCQSCHVILRWGPAARD